MGVLVGQGQAGHAGYVRAAAAACRGKKILIWTTFWTTFWTTLDNLRRAAAMTSSHTVASEVLIRTTTSGGWRLGPGAATAAPFSVL